MRNNLKSKRRRIRSSFAYSQLSLGSSQNKRFETHTFLAKSLESLRLAFLLFVLFDLARYGTSLGKVMRGILCRVVLFLFGPFILCSKLERTADLLDEACEFFRGL